MKIYTKQELIDRIIDVSELGWIHNTGRVSNDGAIGNILEDLLEIEENNLPLPNAAEWELKAGRLNSSALTTLLHVEPSPRALRIVPQVLLPLYGWKHQKAGLNYPENEMSFRATIKTTYTSTRGFSIVVDDVNQKVEVSFDSQRVDPVHDDWLQEVEERVGLAQLNPQPYWGFSDLTHAAGTKLVNMFYVEAERRREKQDNKKVEYFRYVRLTLLRNFSPSKFIQAIRDGHIYVDFDARTGHNHGTKFRTHSNHIKNFYEHSDVIFDKQI